ncbi:MAG: hypothetical protein HW389_1771 [Bacteroidetes bacterium]|nr:hypothetical protein [Bacteroidota bacterium]
MISHQRDVYECHFWERTLGQETSLFIYNHPSTVKFEATVIKPSRGERDSPGRLDGINVNFSQVH